MENKKQEQELDSLLADYFICPSCHIVARHHKKKGGEYRCPRCGAPGEGARPFFPVSVIALVKLMEGLCQPSGLKKAKAAHWRCKVSGEKALGVVIIFCTLIELLLQGFLAKFMAKVGIPEKIQIRLFKDNVSVSRRIQELFLTITDVEWKEAVRMLKDGYGVKVLRILKFYNQAVLARNWYLYGGREKAIPESMPGHCLDQVSSLLTLFVALHNEYIARLVF